MKFHHVVLESIAAITPPRCVRSTEIEERLRPLYERLKLPFGRLELMTGIRERSFWPRGTVPSDGSAQAIRAVLARSKISAEKLGVLVHGAVCRDMLEPATAAFVHRKAGLPPHVQLFDVSNACLGFLNACTIVGAMIDAGQISAGVIACAEDGEPLVESTIERLLAGDLDRNAIKPFFANLTIGAGAVAAVLCHESLSPNSPRLNIGVAQAATEHNTLCVGDRASGDGLHMQTDSEALLLAGIAAAKTTWTRFTQETGRDAAAFDRFICHQVGSAHRRLLYETLGLDLAKDFSTFETCGNIGSVSLPLTLAHALEQKFIQPGHRVALLGIGSGINCLMLSLDC